MHHIFHNMQRKSLNLSSIHKFFLLKFYPRKEKFHFNTLKILRYLLKLQWRKFNIFKGFVYSNLALNFYFTKIYILFLQLKSLVDVHSAKEKESTPFCSPNCPSKKKTKMDIRLERNLCLLFKLSYDNRIKGSSSY